MGVASPWVLDVGCALERIEAMQEHDPISGIAAAHAHGEVCREVTEPRIHRILPAVAGISLSRCWRIIMVLLLIGAAHVTAAPQASGASGNCFPLSQSSVCNGFQGASVKPFQYGSTSVDTPADMNIYIAQVLSTPDFKSNLFSMFQCNPQRSNLNAARTGVQFFTSFQCALRASQSSADCPAATGSAGRPFALCKSSCQAYVNSLDALFSSQPAACQGPTKDDIQKVISELQSKCNSDPYFNATSNCVDGAQNEKTTCGMAPLAEICSRCQSFQGSTTCVNALGNSQNSGDQDSSSSSATILISISVVALVLIFAGIITVVWIRKQKAKNNVRKPVVRVHRVSITPLSSSSSAPSTPGYSKHSGYSSRSKGSSQKSRHRSPAPIQTRSSNHSSRSASPRSPASMRSPGSANSDFYSVGHDGHPLPPMPALPPAAHHGQNPDAMSSMYALPMETMRSSSRTQSEHPGGARPPRESDYPTLPQPLPPAVHPNQHMALHVDDLNFQRGQRIEVEELNMFILPSATMSTRAGKRTTGAPTELDSRVNGHRPGGAARTTAAPTELGSRMAPRRVSSTLTNRLSLAKTAGYSTIARPPPQSDEEMFYVAIEAYDTKLRDEMDLTPGDIILVEQIFDDGWGKGVNITHDVTGFLPLVCTVPIEVWNKKSSPK